jgi:hypothetical protein
MNRRVEQPVRDEWPTGEDVETTGEPHSRPHGSQDEWWRNALLHLLLCVGLTALVIFAINAANWLK